MEGNHTETTRLFGVMMLNEVSSDGDETKLNISKRCDETVSPGLCKSYDAKSNVREPFFEEMFMKERDLKRFNRMRLTVAYKTFGKVSSKRKEWK